MPRFKSGVATEMSATMSAKFAVPIRSDGSFTANLLGKRRCYPEDYEMRRRLYEVVTAIIDKVMANAESAR
jgi:hypothetical protein